MSRTTLVTALLVLAGVGSLAEAKDDSSVRLVAVKGMGKRKTGDKPALQPGLARYRALLLKLPYDRYDARGQGVKRAKTGKKLRFVFTKRVLKYQAQVQVTKDEQKEDHLLVKMIVTKPAPPPKKEQVKVADFTVSVKDGGHFVIQCSQAYPDGDLLFLVTASSRKLQRIILTLPW